ncbi:asparagine synthase (glutamine-hydrolyzing) (plasmid) [Alteromonas mediterranea]|nr:asparagine synthase (glutamine-hydrolyzing) [Alteromonas mediterranea]APE00277.1 asparagine synthase (glutamine-hydrolyzing) [Alteromonas mediterranea]
MCGFAVAASLFDAAPPEPERVRRMQAAIAHRGPDDQGFMTFGNVIMAHQRLSIIDLSSPAQPAITNDDRFAMVYNGEIYNYVALRKELQINGVTFSTQCDTEVLLKGFACFGHDFFSRLDGMFSAVILDRKYDRITIVRDRTGIKPLYFSMTNKVALFASELSSIQAFEPSQFKELNPEAIDNYMMLGYVVEPKTHIINIEQLPAGHYGVLDLKEGGYHIHEYWSLKETMHAPHQTLSINEGQNILSESIRSQLVADVPIGTFLSGGLDSSIVTKIASQQLSEPDKIHCYSAGFSVTDYDEVPLALEIAESIGANHSSVYFDESLLSQVGDIRRIYSAPFADNAALPTYLLSQKASRNVKVLLSGDGADELFYGYRNHRLMLVEESIKSKVPNPVRKHVFNWLSKGYPNSPRLPRFLRAKSTLASLSMSLSESYCCAMSSSSRMLLSEIYSPQFKAKLNAFTTESEFARIGGELEHHDPMKVMQYLDFKTYLPGSVLTKVDRATMHAGVEARVPFLSNAVLDSVLPQPSGENLGWGKQKAQLRSWANNLLPNQVSTREKKSFTSPLDMWFRTLQYPAFHRMIMTDELLASEIFDIRKIDAMMRDHHRGKANYGTTLWALAVLAQSIPF